MVVIEHWGFREEEEEEQSYDALAHKISSDHDCIFAVAAVCVEKESKFVAVVVVVAAAAIALAVTVAVDVVVVVAAAVFMLLSEIIVVIYTFSLLVVVVVNFGGTHKNIFFGYETRFFRFSYKDIFFPILISFRREFVFFFL